MGTMNCRRHRRSGPGALRRGLTTRTSRPRSSGVDHKRRSNLATPARVGN